MSYSELKEMSRDDLLGLAETLGLEVETTIAHDELVKLLLEAESEVSEEEGSRNRKIDLESAVETYLDVYEAGGTLRDFGQKLMEFPGQTRVRGINELYSLIKRAKDVGGYDLPKLAGMPKGGDKEKKKLLKERIAALKARGSEG